MTRKKQEMTEKGCNGAIVTIKWWRRLGIFCSIMAATAIVSPAQDPVRFVSLHDFAGWPTDGANPGAPVVQGTEGNLYGTAGQGGANTVGTIFKMTPSGVLTTLYEFCSQSSCADGEYPNALTLGTDGNFCGTTGLGGANGEGIAFKFTPNGTLTVLYNFAFSGGFEPGAGLVEGKDGDFYGSTVLGGTYSNGTIFKLTGDGALTTLYNFGSQGGDGVYPEGALVEGPDGAFYGTTVQGGFHGLGTIFRVTPAGTLTTLHSFDGTDGSNPVAGLVLTRSGEFYGTTPGGGFYESGTVFSIAPNSGLTTLYNFCSHSGCTDGAQPYAGLVQGTDGSLYGTTQEGGTNQSCYFGSFTCGTVFRITPTGVLTTLHNFDGSDGGSPTAPPVQATDGTFYGTTSTDGSSTCNSGAGCGTLFALSVGLGRFVETLPTSGKVGAQIRILGTDLTGATNVSFNGTPATFNVVSHSQIVATVPEGATGGYVTVTTPNGTLKSNTRFQVRP